MRILHTSDWHLGRSFGEHRLLDEQARFVDWVVEVVRSENIDLVAIAGDLYDRSVPPADAVELFHTALRRLLDAGAEIAGIAGNHDSAERIGSTDGLLADGLVLRGGYRRAAEVDVRPYHDGLLAIVATPYLDPVFAPIGLDSSDRLPHAVDCTSAHDSDTAVLAAFAGGADRVGSAPQRSRPTHETVLRRSLDAARRGLPVGMRSLVLAHAFVTGAEPSDSERTLAVGDAAMVSSAVFDGFDYIALGHLHRSQIVGGDERVRYSGAPLPYSFSETTQKEVVVVELDPDGDARSKPLPVDVGRSVTTVRGSLDELLASPGNDRDWIRIELTNAHPVADAHRRLRDRFPHVVEIARVGAAPLDRERLSVQAVRDRSTDVLAAQFLRGVSDATDTRDLDLLTGALRRAERRLQDTAVA